MRFLWINFFSLEAKVGKKINNNENKKTKIEKKYFFEKLLYKNSYIAPLIITLYE